MQIRIIILSLFIISLTTLGAHSAKIADRNGVPVKLFGQPCTLEGAFPKKTLEHVHAISPAQIPPIRKELEAVAALRAIDVSTDIPTALNTYRTKLRTYVQAHKEFFVALRNARKEQKSETVLAAARGFSRDKTMGELRMRLEFFLKKADDTNHENLLDSFEALIEPRPESEFHRAIYKLKITYQCSFEGE